MHTSDKTPVSIREAVFRIKSYSADTPWLKKPVYHRFISALDPHAPKHDFDPYQWGLRKFAFFGDKLEGPYEPVGIALAYWNSNLIRSHLNALFFGGATVAQVAESTNLDALSVDAFKRLFCEIEVFRAAPLLLMEYIHKMPELTDSDKKEKALYRMAVDFGWEWVVWKITRGLGGHRPGIKIVDTMANLAFWRALEASVSPLTSNSSKEGRHYMKLAADLALSKHHAKMGEINSIRDLALKLLADDPEEYDAKIHDEPAPGIEDLLYQDEDKED